MNNSVKLNTIIDENKVVKKRYSNKEENMNTISHIIGAIFGFVVLIMCLIKSSKAFNTLGIISSIIYGLSVILLYSCSSYYHGLKNERLKRIFRVFDHCSIYVLIAGTYTPVALSGMLETHFTSAIIMLLLVWSLAIIAIILNAISIEKFKIVSMVLNLLIGWMAIFFLFDVINAISFAGFMYIISGGIIYTLGAVLYGIGRKKQYFHFIFHIFCLLGTLVHFIGIYQFCL
ncbi:hemolysin III family protein [Acholeplasma sp. OttesenSCG-928-E16]|nr:hemolysin III family protein [Acholeplasma sp. OttesenSCG-928-E16]